MGNLIANQLPDKHAIIMNKYNQSYNMIGNMDYYLFNKTRQDHHNKNKLIIIHKNIWGIKNKVEEFLISLTDIAPQIICLSEHHLRLDEIDNVNFNQYMIGNSFCRQEGVCVLIKKNVQFDTINFDQFSKEKDFKTCALKFQFMPKLSLFVYIELLRVIFLIF
jgi:hypothetical protein